MAATGFRGQLPRQRGGASWWRSLGNHLEETFGLVLEAEESIQVEVKEVLDEAEALDFATYKTFDGCSS